ncbi:MAG: DegV family protein [Candidatus Bathyarchaeota archaeon]|nr:DegV family protein [Candidatus Bathyarchaeota archaeon]
MVTDSTADLPPSLAEELGITVVPLLVLFGHEALRDGIDLTTEEFFERLTVSTQLPRTSQPSIGDFQEVYQRLARDTDRIVSIHLSAKFSGTVETARLAADNLRDRCRIEVIDSHSVSMGLGMAVLAAARAAREGADLEEVAAAARSASGRLGVAVTLETLEYLRRGGRIGRAAAFLGTLLHVRPILTIRDGEAYPLARARSRARALAQVYELAMSHPDIEEVAVMHANSPQDAEALAARVRAEHPQVPVHMGHLGPAIGVHGGPGIVGMAVLHAKKGQE